MAASPASSTVESPKATHSGKKPYLCAPVPTTLLPNTFDIRPVADHPTRPFSAISGWRGKALHRGILATAGLGFFLFGYVLPLSFSLPTTSSSG